MIRPRVTIKQTINTSTLRKDILAKVRGSYVTIGVHEDAGRYSGSNAPSVVEVALWNEFGTSHIPERSFLRAALDENVALINNWREEAIGMLLQGAQVETALSMLGFRIMTLIQNKIKSNVPPPLAQGTVDAKVKDGVAPVTLIDTGLLLRSIAYKVVTK